MKTKILTLFLFIGSIAGVGVAQTIGNQTSNVGNGSAAQSNSGPVKSSSAWSTSNTNDNSFDNRAMQ